MKDKNYWQTLLTSQKLKLVLVLGVVALGTGACGKAGKFEKLLEKSTGDTYTVEKSPSLIDGYVVYKNQKTGEYVAYNLSKYDKKKHKSLEDYMKVTDGDDIVHNLKQEIRVNHGGYWAGGYWSTRSEAIYDQYGDLIGYYDYDYYVERYWVDQTTTDYFYKGGGFTFEDTRSGSKDLEKLASIGETMETAAVQALLTTSYGLSEDRAEKIAKLSRQLKQISETRELTDADKDFFSKQALGSGYSEFEKALKESAAGKKESFDSLVEVAAKANALSVEQTRKILDDLSKFAE